ncbi:MAG: hypothetical protein IPM47_06325 [Sphingobacteriales bacterium]|nr:MAG: hypothetical protein IPM47_06325 [Sphingobacteriales bacterium]
MVEDFLASPTYDKDKLYVLKSSQRLYIIKRIQYYRHLKHIGNFSSSKVSAVFIKTPLSPQNTDYMCDYIPNETYQKLFALFSKKEVTL